MDDENLGQDCSDFQRRLSNGLAGMLYAGFKRKPTYLVFNVVSEGVTSLSYHTQWLFDDLHCCGAAKLTLPRIPQSHACAYDETTLEEFSEENRLVKQTLEQVTAMLDKRSVKLRAIELPRLILGLSLLGDEAPTMMVGMKIQSIQDSYLTPYSDDEPTQYWGHDKLDATLVQRIDNLPTPTEVEVVTTLPKHWGIPEFVTSKPRYPIGDILWISSYGLTQSAIWRDPESDQILLQGVQHQASWGPKTHLAPFEAALERADAIPRKVLQWRPQNGHSYRYLNTLVLGEGRDCLNRIRAQLG